MNKLLSLTIIFLFLISFPAITQAQEDEYKIAPEDVLQISVYEEDDLNTRMRVSPKGEITFPLIEKVHIAGLTVREAEEKIEAMLQEDYLTNPQVNIFIEEYHSRQVTVMGEVNLPGSYEFTSEKAITLMEAIALAEGFTEEANLNEVKVIRMKDGEKITIPINVAHITRRGDKAKDIVLQKDDIIFVPRMHERKFSVMGEVSKPGTYELNKEKLTRVMEAIATAGGFTEKAKKNGTKVIRMRYGKKEIIPIKITDITKKGADEKDIVLRPDDIVFVPESFW